MSINLDPNNIQFQVEKNQETGKTRIGIYSNEDQEHQLSYKIDSIAVKVLPKQKNLLQRFKEAILTAFTWKWVKMDSETMVNINSLVKHTGLSAHQIRNSDNLQNTIRNQMINNPNVKILLDNPEQDTSKFDLQDRDSGFIKLSGFEFKQRNDGYITARNLLSDAAQCEEKGDVSPLDESKAELDRLLKNSGKDEALAALSANPNLLKIAANEYKIHLMPTEEHSNEVLERILDELRKNPDLRKHVAQYKVLIKNVENQEFPAAFKEGGIPPRIVLYAENKEAAQAILDAMMNVFSEEDAKIYGCNETPRLNFQVNELIFYAQGTSGIKSKAQELGVADQFLEPDGIHFKGDSRLTF